MIATRGSTQPALWKLLSIEGLLIMLSVFMGMWLQAWYENRHEEAVAERALKGVYEQAIENCHDLLNVHGYYQQVVAKEMPPEGLRLGTLRTEAWDFLVASESLVHLDYPVARTVAAIENEQDLFLGMHDAYVQALFNLILSDPTRMAQGRHPEAERMVISDLLLSQNRLFEHYGRLIELIGTRDEYRDLDTDRCLQAARGKINGSS